MRKTSSDRNFGYGKQMEWAGKQALRANFGDRRYNTVGSHAERFRHFATWCREQKQIRDAKEITREDVEAYCQSLAEQVDAEDIKVSYAINLISSVNVTLSSMRGDDKLRVKPSPEVGSRAAIRRRVCTSTACASVPINCVGTARLESPRPLKSRELSASDAGKPRC